MASQARPRVCSQVLIIIDTKSAARARAWMYTQDTACMAESNSLSGRVLVPPRQKCILTYIC